VASVSGAMLRSELNRPPKDQRNFIWVHATLHNGFRGATLCDVRETTEPYGVFKPNGPRCRWLDLNAAKSGRNRR
jgi:hypothetical protein